MKWILLLSVLIAQQLPAQVLRVAVAANMLAPITKIASAFEEKNNIKLELIAGASGSLTSQIVNGAPYDVFISANYSYAQQLQDLGLATAPQIICNGVPVLWSKTNRNDDPISKILDNIADIKLAIADPVLAPYGTATKQWLQKNSYWDVVRPSLVFGNSINQVNHFIASGNVDLAFTSNSARHSGALVQTGYWYLLPQSDDLRVSQTICIVSGGDAALQFVDYLFSPAAQEILATFGYELPNNG